MLYDPNYTLTTATRSTVDGHRQLELHHDDVTIYKSKFKRFVIPYKLINGEITPFKSNPKKYKDHIKVLLRAQKEVNKEK